MQGKSQFWVGVFEEGKIGCQLCEGLSLPEGFCRAGALLVRAAQLPSQLRTEQSEGLCLQFF